MQPNAPYKPKKIKQYIHLLLAARLQGETALWEPERPARDHAALLATEIGTLEQQIGEMILAQAAALTASVKQICT